MHPDNKPPDVETLSPNVQSADSKKVNRKGKGKLSPAVSTGPTAVKKQGSAISQVSQVTAAPDDVTASQSAVNASEKTEGAAAAAAADKSNEESSNEKKAPVKSSKSRRLKSPKSKWRYMYLSLFF